MIRSRIALQRMKPALLAALLAGPGTAIASERPFEMDDLVVTATRTEQPMRLAPASISLLSGKDLDLATTPNLLEAIRELSSLSLQGRGVGGRKVLLLRGMEARHSLILVDGRRISATDEIVGHSDFQYDWVPISGIERIEIVRGPMSALYGSEAMGGVINIITKPVLDRWTGELSLTGGLREDGRGGEDFSTGFNLAGPISETLGVRISGIYRQLNDTPLAADDRLTELEGTELYGVNSQLTWAVHPDHRVEWLYSRVIEDRWRDTDTRGAAPFYRSGYDLDRQLVGMRWLPRFGDFTGQLGFYETRTDVEGYRNDGGTPVTPQYLRDRVGEFDLSGDVLENHYITIGGEWREERLRHPAFTGGSGSVRQTGVYIQDQWKVTERFGLTGAIRLDDHGFYGSELTPRLYAVWQMAPEWVLKGGYGRGFKAPTLKQSSAEYRFDGAHTFLGNPNVGPETSDTYEISLLFEPNDVFSGSVTAFRNQVSDLIAIQILEIIPGPPARRINTYVNVERARMDGVETEFTNQTLGASSLERFARLAGCP